MPDDREDWEVRFDKKFPNALDEQLEDEVYHGGIEYFIDDVSPSDIKQFIRDLLKSRPAELTEDEVILKLKQFFCVSHGDIVRNRAFRLSTLAQAILKKQGRSDG